MCLINQFVCSSKNPVFGVVHCCTMGPFWGPVRYAGSVTTEWPILAAAMVLIVIDWFKLNTIYLFYFVSAPLLGVTKFCLL